MTPPVSALPFVIKRSTDAYSGIEYTATTVTAHGLLRIDEGGLVIQWRVRRKTDRMGFGYSSEEAMEPVRESWVPLARLASARLRAPWWRVGRGPVLVVTASDLRAFEGLAGPEGLALAHPSQVEFQLQRQDAEAGRDFAAELELAIGEYQLRLAEGAAEEQPRLPRRPDGD